MIIDETTPDQEDDSMRFRTTILAAGGTATGMEIPSDVVEALGAGERPPVRVTINGFTYRNTVAVMGGVYMIGVSAANRAGAGVAAGDVVDVDLELDTEPRVVTVPDDFAAALDADLEAKRTFEGASYSNRQRIVLAIEDAKTDETRQRRIAKAIGTLREGRIQGVALPGHVSHPARMLRCLRQNMMCTCGPAARRTSSLAS